MSRVNISKGEVWLEESSFFVLKKYMWSLFVSFFDFVFFALHLIDSKPIFNNLTSPSSSKIQIALREAWIYSYLKRLLLFKLLNHSLIEILLNSSF